MKLRRMRETGNVAYMGEARTLCTVQMRKLEGKSPLARPRHRWEDKSKSI
jgi:hypothetical protein